MNSLKRFGGLLAVPVVLLIIYSLLPLRDAFQFAPDEGFEVIKPFMMNKGFRLYSDIWNDQPPVLSYLLCGAFKAFGTSMLTARMVAAAFGALLLLAFHELVRLRSGRWAALLCCFFLVASPSVLLLSVSTMLEVPAFALALVSVVLLSLRSSPWINSNRYLRAGVLLASGAAMGVSLQTKLTAILVGPALLVELIMQSRARAGKAWQRAAVKAGSIWGIGFLLIFTLIGLAWGKGALASSFKSHTTAMEVAGLDRAQDHKFDPKLLGMHIESAIAALVGVAMALQKRRIKELAVPLTLLATAIVIHANHRPWWNYYYLHFAIPIAWLAGWAANKGIQFILTVTSRRLPKFLTARFIATGTVGISVALVIMLAERRFEALVSDLRHRPTAEGNAIVKEMRKHVNDAQWVYSEDGIYAFHAKLSVNPELTVIMPKRFWSGQITTERIIEVCSNNRAGMIVIPIKALNTEWNTWLTNDYNFLAKDSVSVLYGRNARP
jgi:hypothetical protein